MEYIRLLRPHQWVKNLFIFLPILAAGATQWPLLRLALCFAAFCLASSAVYIANDILDMERDRQHATKKNRPIASRKIGSAEGWALSICLMLSSVILASMASRETVGFVVAYLALSGVYCFWTKHVPILDCASIALGFCLRLLAGGVGFGLAINPLLLIVCYFSAMAMALVKRRVELSLVPVGEASTRSSLKGLNTQSIDMLVGVFSAASIVVYSQWTLAIAHPLAIFTLPILSILFSRVVWLAYLDQNGEDFSKTLFNDWFALTSTIMFIAMLILALYA